MFQLHVLGINTYHTGDFCIDRPTGSGDCLMLVFKTGAFLILDGKEYMVQPNQAIIYTGDCPQYYRGCEEKYVDHYIHFDFDSSTDTSKIVFNQLLTSDFVHEAEMLLTMLSHEQLSDSKNRLQYISSQIEMILMKLSEQPNSGKKKENSAILSAHAVSLNELRATIYSSPTAFSSVEELANQMNLSPSHFQQLYRTYFGVSCYEDLLTSRTKLAQHYLRNTTLQVKEISGLCGYENEKCFLHRFKARTGLTPSQYRMKSYASSE